MKNKLDALFAEANRPLLVTYLCAGDPDLDTSRQLYDAMDAAGADILEIGIPFSDPGADGPAIQLASERALATGTTLDAVLDMVGQLKGSAPRVLFGYLNPFLAYGYDKLAQRCEEVGIQGLLCVDCPPEEEPELWHALRSRGVHPILLLAPTTPEERIVGVAHAGGGFVYYVSMTGVTGADFEGGDALAQRIKRVGELAELPVAVGFGIATPSDAAQVGRSADAVVVGSALVRLVAQHGVDAVPPVAALTRGLRLALEPEKP